MVQDFQYAARALFRQPLFTAVAALTLAFGIGANSAVFSVLDAILFRPLPYSDPDRLVWLWERNVSQGLPVMPVSPANFSDWKRQSRSFSGMSAWRDQSMTLTGIELPERVAGARVLPGLLDVLGVKPALGRGFEPEDGKPERERVLILTHGFWQRRFGGDPNLVGRSVEIDGAAHTVVGIMPERFRFPFAQVEALTAWSPAGGEAAERGAKARYLRVVGRLAKGSTLGSARAEMQTIASRLEKDYPQSNRGYGVNVMPLPELFVADFRPALVTLMAAVGTVALIACANVANLLLARGVTRGREIAVRLALGAGYGRIARLLLAESLLLGLLGGAAGLLLAAPSVRPLAGVIPNFNLPLPGLDSVQVDGRVVAFTIAVSLATGLIFGIAPVVQVFRPTLYSELKEGARGGGGDRLGRRLRATLVICEVALAVALAVAAGLVTGSFRWLNGLSPGFQVENALSARVTLPAAKYTRPQRAAFFRRLTARLEELPGVGGVAAVNFVPLDAMWGVIRFRIEGRLEEAGEPLTANDMVVTHSYFRVMGIPLLRGRGFTEADDEQGERVAIVNRALARRLWPEKDPVGARLRLEGEGPETPPLTVVGVVGDVQHFDVGRDAPGELYRCYPQAPAPSMAAILRTSADPAGLAGAVRAAVRGIDPQLAVYSVGTLREVVDKSLWATRLSMTLFNLFSVLALSLAAVGVYGVSSYAIAQRRREIGLRMALGASPAQAVRLLAGRGILLAVWGAGAGLVIAGLLGRVLAATLPGVQPFDAGVFGGATLLLMAVACAANVIPAVRAVRVERSWRGASQVETLRAARLPCRLFCCKGIGERSEGSFRCT